MKNKSDLDHLIAATKLPQGEVFALLQKAGITLTSGILSEVRNCKKKISEKKLQEIAKVLGFRIRNYRVETKFEFDKEEMITNRTT